MKRQFVAVFFATLLSSSQMQAMGWRRLAASLITGGGALLAVSYLVRLLEHRSIQQPAAVVEPGIMQGNYRIAGTYGQRNVVPGWGEIDCSLVAMTAAGYFLFRQNWDAISDDELTLIAVDGIFSGRDYRAGLYTQPERSHDADQLIPVDEVGPWHNAEFLNRLVYHVVCSADMGGEACRYDAMPLLEMSDQGAVRVMAFIQQVAEDFDEDRVCMVMTVGVLSCIVCFDRATGRWLFYDSHHHPDIIDRDGSALYVFDRGNEATVAQFLDARLHIVGANPMFAMYAPADRAQWHTAAPAVATGETRAIFDRALALFAAGNYAAVPALLSECCSQLPEHAALAQPAVVLAQAAQHAQESLAKVVRDPATAAQSLHTFMAELLATARCEPDIYGEMPTEQKAFTIDADQLLGRLTTVPDERGGFLRFLSARLRSFLATNDSGVLGKLPSGEAVVPVYYEMALFLTRDLSAIFELLAATTPDRLEQADRRLVALLELLMVDYVHIAPVVRWFLEGLRTQIALVRAL